ncbi:NAD-dependent epimerase/dehydratase family protein [Haloferax mediterranei ATCC 33500]|uniref:Epimerase n=1 Tax=Haloferax mediterranei (strain ATCC 33500 / DSM 1411 / JCM 8866 / NBRC 14739 / NCIMB 2177 / R-4) TaxID=523841 RepID=I3R220_HALMT|nr:NAD(P)H-binding protein [Haloferax mediterranei]AFK18280.1 NADH dehydrogenase 32K chain [Haloferax mediterranei ATCC 33500]AHZ22319.1 epimerase [Haloferax mediterranei ATCC 33500]EMA02447.1 NADH dehydrogenase 32K chain [Haloferax mediterranei ATCC 33500]MDX5988370.1 NAD(P)H-binding protein [Haloferax mediterranei ATCC 33500]QCQ74802.1 NAD-dependent epimerase/dehydratase family protein [Haloferax mediterranei ATCC 33500]
MNVLLLGASGRIGRRIAAELLDRGHTVTGVSRSGEIDGIDDTNFEAVSGDATDTDAVAELAADHDAVASALGPAQGDAESLLTMTDAVIEGLRAADVERLVWTGGAGGLRVGPDTRLIETDGFPDELVPIAQAHIDALERIRAADDLDWSYIAPAASIEPGERTGEYRTSDGQLVVDEDDESHISMEDFAVVFVDELENDAAIRTQLGVGY